MEIFEIQDKFKRTIARCMELLELSNSNNLKEPIKRELWFLFKNIEKEYGVNGEVNGQEKNYNK